MTNRNNTTETRKTGKVTFWENIQLLALAFTIVGQCVVGYVFLVGQALWLAANLIAVVRNFVLHRPMADKIKDCALLAITIGIIAVWVI